MEYPGISVSEISMPSLLQTLFVHESKVALRVQAPSRISSVIDLETYNME